MVWTVLVISVVFGGIGDLICCGGWDICSNASCDFGGLLMV